MLPYGGGTENRKICANPPGRRRSAAGPVMSAPLLELGSGFIVS